MDGTKYKYRIKTIIYLRMIENNHGSFLDIPFALNKEWCVSIFHSLVRWILIIYGNKSGKNKTTTVT